MANLLDGLEPDDLEVSVEAMAYINQYTYRKMFNLSLEDYLKEPANVYLMNMAIETMIKQRGE